MMRLITRFRLGLVKGAGLSLQAGVFASLLLFAFAGRSQEGRVATSPAPPRVFLLDGNFLESVRHRLAAGDKVVVPALARVEKDAAEALKTGPFSVVNKKPTPTSGDKHDYMSQAPYFWPNPASSNGLPYIRRDGERNPELRLISDHREMDEMANNVETLALAYFFTGKEVYASRATVLLRAWFFDPSTRMNPNLQFAQAVPGVNDGRGTGLIESRSLTRVVDAVGLLAGSKNWSSADQKKLETWFNQFLNWMMESKHGQAEGAAKNNHGTYYDVQVVSYALFLGKTQVATKVMKEAPQKRIAVQIDPDGRQPLELVRTKAWSYSVANLSGLMLLARLGENVNVDLWHFETGDGRGILKALNFLAPYGLGEQKWPYKQIGDWPKHALDGLIRQAALKYPDGQYRHWAKKLPPLEEDSRNRLLRPVVEGDER